MTPAEDLITHPSLEFLHFHSNPVIASLSSLDFRSRYFLGANASHSLSLRRLSLTSSSLSACPVNFLLRREVVFVSVMTGIDGCEESELACDDGLSCDELDSDSEESRVVVSEALDPEMRRARRKRSLRAIS
jgi:hypothetical protein